MRTMGVTFAYSRDKTKSHANICRMFATVLEEFSWSFAAFYNSGQNLDPPLHAESETAHGKNS